MMDLIFVQISPLGPTLEIKGMGAGQKNFEKE